MNKMIILKLQILRFVVIPVLLAFSVTGISGCSWESTESENGTGDSGDRGRVIIVTIYPLKAILGEIVGDRVEITCLLNPGASPHTYEPKPSDVSKVENSMALFRVGPMLDDWASSFEKSKKFGFFEMVPRSLRMKMDHEGHDHGHGHDGGDSSVYDPHFWLSPVTVKAVTGELAEILSELDPDGSSIYRENAANFSEKLDELESQVSLMLEPYAGRSLLLFHPSFQYFMRDYNLETAGLIEEFPGREPSPKYLVELMEKISEKNVSAIFTEPQLPEAPARMLEEETGLPVYVLDPLGGVEGRMTYSGLILYNAEVIRDALGE